MKYRPTPDFDDALQCDFIRHGLRMQVRQVHEDTRQVHEASTAGTEGTTLHPGHDFIKRRGSCWDTGIDDVKETLEGFPDGFADQHACKVEGGVMWTTVTRKGLGQWTSAKANLVRVLFKSSYGPAKAALLEVGPFH